MTELYSYDKYRGYHLVVELLEEGYEGFAYKDDPNTPVFAKWGKSGESVRLEIHREVDALLEEVW